MNYVRQYVLAKCRRWEEREAFRQAWRQSHRGRAVRYPGELRELPEFAEWLRAFIQEARHAGRALEDDVEHYAQPPERKATCHRQMYCHGMHFRVRSSEHGLVTRDSGVVASFTRQLRWGLANGRPLEYIQEYVGYIEEILVLDSATTALRCYCAIGFEGHEMLGYQAYKKMGMGYP